MEPFFLGMSTTLLLAVAAIGVLLRSVIRRIYAHRFEQNLRRHVLQMGTPRKGGNDEKMINGISTIVVVSSKFDDADKMTEFRNAKWIENSAFPMGPPPEYAVHEELPPGYDRY